MSISVRMPPRITGQTDDAMSRMLEAHGVPAEFWSRKAKEVAEKRRSEEWSKRYLGGRCPFITMK